MQINMELYSMMIMNNQQSHKIQMNIIISNFDGDKVIHEQMRRLTKESSVPMERILSVKTESTK